MQIEQLCRRARPSRRPWPRRSSARSSSCRAAERGARGARTARRDRRGNARTRRLRSSIRSGAEARGGCTAARASWRAAPRGAAACRCACSPIRRRPDAPDRIASSAARARSRTLSASAAGRSGRSPSSDPRWRAMRFEVEHLRALGGERGDQAALAGAGEPADDVVAKAPRQRPRARATTLRRYAR